MYIVEDEVLIAMELQDRLIALGFEVCGHALRGEQALRDVAAIRPDVVLMDVNLGRGLTGVEVAERLRAVCDVPVVFLTAYSTAELVDRLTGTRAAAVLVKPLASDALQAGIARALAMRATPIDADG